MVKQTPHGNTLIVIMVKSAKDKEVAIAATTKELQMSPRQLCDVELIMNSGFSPLTGFMDKAPYKHVIDELGLIDGLIFDLPVVFDMEDEDLQLGDKVLLKDGNHAIATVEFTDSVVRYKTYEVLKEETKSNRTRWEYLPYSMHMAGPRDAIQHMMIRKNFGCTHFVIGRDMAGSKSSITAEDYCGAYDAQDRAEEKGIKLGVTPVPSLNIVYTDNEIYITVDGAKEKKLNEKKLSGTKFRQTLQPSSGFSALTSAAMAQPRPPSITAATASAVMDYLRQKYHV